MQSNMQMIQIFVKSTVFDWTHAEKTITLEVEATMTVAIVKAMIQDLEMVPMDEQVLSFDGRTLEDNDSLADYNIQDQSTLLLRQSQVEGAPRFPVHRSPPWRAEDFLERNVRARTAEHDEARARLLISLPQVHLMRAYSYNDETG